MTKVKYKLHSYKLKFNTLWAVFILDFYITYKTLL